MKKINSQIWMRAVLVVFIACGAVFSNAAAAPEAETDGTTVRMWTFLNPEGQSPRERALAQIIDNFHELHPDITVQVEPQIWDQMTGKFLAAHQTGNAPDVMFVYVDDLGTAIDQGALADLNEIFIDGWSDEDVQDFPEPFWNYGTVGGSKYQLMLFPTCDAIFYRADLFRDAGIDAGAVQTWDDFVAAGQSLTQDADGDGEINVWGFGQGFSLEKHDPPVWLTMLLDLQTSLLSADGTANWANQAGVQSMEAMLEMINVYGITQPGAISTSIEDLYEGLSAGTYAMILGSALRMERVRGEASFDPIELGILPKPTWDGVGVGPSQLRGWPVAIWADSEVKEAAGTFVEYMFSPESDLIWGEVGGQIPMRLSTLSDPFYDEPQNAYMHVVLDGLAQGGWALPLDANMKGYMIDVLRAVHATMQGADPRSALADAEDSFNERQ